MSALALVFPQQLFANHPALADKAREVHLVAEPLLLAGW